eukprot:6177061-Pleurochrysis_carterae.AAC.1
MQHTPCVERQMGKGSSAGARAAHVQGQTGLGCKEPSRLMPPALSWTSIFGLSRSALSSGVFVACGQELRWRVRPWRRKARWARRQSHTWHGRTPSH